MDIGQVEAARRLGISLSRLNEIVLGKRGIRSEGFARSTIFALRTSKTHRTVRVLEDARDAEDLGESLACESALRVSGAATPAGVQQRRHTHDGARDWRDDRCL